MTADQFVRLNRGLVEDGTWAELWGVDRGASTSLLPVLALLSWGYQTTGARARYGRLQQWSGLSRRLVKRSFATLQGLCLADADLGQRSGTVSFKLSPSVFGSTNYFVMRRALIETDTWAHITRSGRSVAVAVASCLPAITWCDVQEEDVSAMGSTDSDEGGDPLLYITRHGYLPQTVSDWLWRQGAVEWHDDEMVEDDIGEYFKPAHYEAERVGVLSLAHLSHRTGLDRATVSRAIDGLAWRNRGGRYATVVASLSTPAGHWFHTPDRWWGWAQPSAAAELETGAVQAAAASST